MNPMMELSTAALLVTEPAAIGSDGAASGTLGGLGLVERAALAIQRAGIARIHIVGPAAPDDATLGRLRARGLLVSWHRGERPFSELPAAQRLLVVPAATLFEPAAVGALLRAARLAPGEAALAIDRHPDAGRRLVEVADGRVRSILATGGAANAGLAVLTAAAALRCRDARSLVSALERLARTNQLVAVDIAPHFCRRLEGSRDRAHLERAYIRHLNGGERESYFTKKIRRFSVPLTQRLLRWPITPNQVTLASLVLSLAAGALFGVGKYWSGLAGALLYYASTVLDCVDGEVARTKFRESAFGCWLETMTDYASYVFVWAGITFGMAGSSPSGVPGTAATIALGATLLVFALTGYLRRRVTRTDPGQFDDALATTLARQGRGVHRFAGWARQWIKRSTLAHVLLVLALLGAVDLLLVLWAGAAVGAFILGLGAAPVLLRRAAVEAPGAFSSLVTTRG